MKEMIKSLIIDFLFPKEAKILRLEALSIETMLRTLPQAKKLEDKKVLAVFDYSHPLVKEVIWEIKYKGNGVLADKLAVILYDILRHELSEKVLFESALWKNSPILLIPIPVSDKRRYERGWNQTELLTERLVNIDAGKMFKHLPHRLVKVRHTESQTKTTSRNERLKNLTDSMTVLDEPSVAGQCVVLVDDVVTTGSTFAEARRALSTAGAKKILCIAVAH